MEGQMEGWMEGQKNDRRTDRPYFIGPFQLPPGIQKNWRIVLEDLSLNENLAPAQFKDLKHLGLKYIYPEKGKK